MIQIIWITVLAVAVPLYTIGFVPELARIELSILMVLVIAAVTFLVGRQPWGVLWLLAAVPTVLLVRRTHRFHQAVAVNQRAPEHVTHMLCGCPACKAGAR